jgi:nucleoside-diphosphate-sugar epimerase
MTKVLVTGGSGFIGSHLVDSLAEKGYDTRVMDRHPPKNENVEWSDGDLRWMGDCDKATKDVDVVFHLAARISVDESLDYVWHYFNDNYLTTVNLCSASLKNKIKRLIFASSCEVYGDINEGMVGDENQPCDPISPYAASKYASERAAVAFCQSFALPLTVIRAFNTFGERQRPFRAGSVIPTFILMALQNKNINIHGDGNQVRDYTYVKDVVDAYLLSLEKNLGDLEIFNIASGIPRTVNEIAHKVINHSESKSKITYADDPRGKAQIRRSVGCAEKARKVLGWKPKYDFDESLKGVIKYYKNLSPRRLL